MKQSEWKQLHKKLEQLGCTVRRAGSGHWKVYQEGRMVLVLPSSASDHRSIRNAQALLKRLGIAA